MKIRLESDIDQFLIKEEDRIIYRIQSKKAGGLITLQLYNIYGDEVICLRQKRKWNQIFYGFKHNFTIEKNKMEVGRLYQSKKGINVIYQSIKYRFFGGEHKAKRCIIGFDRKLQVADFVFDESPYVCFRDSNMSALYSLLLCVFFAVLKEDCFKPIEYMWHYNGIYREVYDGYTK